MAETDNKIIIELQSDKPPPAHLRLWAAEGKTVHYCQAKINVVVVHLKMLQLLRLAYSCSIGFNLNSDEFSSIFQVRSTIGYICSVGGNSIWAIIPAGIGSRRAGRCGWRINVLSMGETRKPVMLASMSYSAKRIVIAGRYADYRRSWWAGTCGVVVW